MAIETTTQADEQQWDYCQVELELGQPDTTKARFVAHATSPNGDYVASEGIFFFIDGDELFAKDVTLPFTAKNRNKHTVFLNSLQNGGWQLVEDNEADEWYVKRLRRVTRPPEVKHVTRKQWVWIVGILLIISLPVAYVVRAMLNPFPTGVTRYMELEPIELVEGDPGDPYYRDKILVVNPLPVRVYDPLSGRPDPIHWMLPDDMRAEEVEEIGTVVWVACRSKHVSRKISRDCEISVIDNATQEVVGFAEFLSAKYDPPIPARERIKLRDEAAILDYILNIPKR